MRREKSCMGGFTLMELLLVIAITGVLAAVAAPSMAQWLQQGQLNASAREFRSLLQKTRSEAVRRNRPCALVFDTHINDAPCAAAAFTDPDGDLILDPTEELIDTLTFPSGGVGFDRAHAAGTGIAFAQNGAGQKAVGWSPLGVPRNRTGGLGMGSLYLRNRKGDTRKVVLGSTGTLRIE